MSVIIYKDGEQSMCEPSALQRHLDAGYTLEDKPKRRTRGPGKKKTAANVFAELEPDNGDSED